MMSIRKMQIGAIDPSRKDGSDQTEQESIPIKRSKEEKKVSLKLPGKPPWNKTYDLTIWRKLAREIDVRAATPREIIALSHQLFKAGAIGYEDHISLSFQPEMNLDSPTKLKPFSHERRDYIAFWQSKQENVLRFGGDRKQIEETHRIQALLVYLDNLK